MIRKKEISIQQSFSCIFICVSFMSFYIHEAHGLLLFLFLLYICPFHSARRKGKHKKISPFFSFWPQLHPQFPRFPTSSEFPIFCANILLCDLVLEEEQNIDKIKKWLPHGFINERQIAWFVNWVVLILESFKNGFFDSFYRFFYAYNEKNIFELFKSSIWYGSTTITWKKYYWRNMQLMWYLFNWYCFQITSHVIVWRNLWIFR